MCLRIRRGREINLIDCFYSFINYFTPHYSWNDNKYIVYTIQLIYYIVLYGIYCIVYTI